MNFHDFISKSLLAIVARFVVISVLVLSFGLLLAWAIKGLSESEPAPSACQEQLRECQELTESLVRLDHFWADALESKFGSDPSCEEPPTPPALAGSGSP